MRIGYNKNQIEHFAMFGNAFTLRQNKSERKEMKKKLKAAINFISRRQRYWTFILFNTTKRDQKMKNFAYKQIAKLDEQ